MSEKDESKPRADEPATEAIPKQGGAVKPTPPKLPKSVKAKPAATPPAKPVSGAEPKSTPRPPARPSAEKSDPAESTPVASESVPAAAAVGEAAVGEAAAGETAVGETAAGETAAGETAADKASDSSGEPEDAPTQAIDITKAASEKTAPATPVAPEADPSSADPAEADPGEADPGEAETTALPKVVRAQPRAVAKPPVGPRRIPARGEDPNARSDTRGASPRPRSSAEQAKPLRVGPAPEQTKTRGKGGRRWIAALAAAVLLFAAVGVAGYVYLSGDRADNSPDAQIRTQVTSFTEALSSGDLATLRASSCGDLAVYYRDIPDAEFAEVHRIAAEQGNIPVVDGIDAVQITGDTAIVQVLAYTAANPNERSPRTFDLRLEGEDWKVCNPE